MAKLLSVVEDVFQISGRGSVVVVPGIPRKGDWHVKIGDPLTLRLPNATEASTVVRGIEMASPPHPDFIPILLGLGLTKNDVPIGTEIWVQ
jgi:translation elongation factor EF-Tu-like GTPase